MGDNGGIQSQEENKKEIPQEKQEIKPIALTILLLPDGKVTLTGPIQDRLLCYGLLEMAKEIINDFKNAKKIDLAVPQNHNLINFLRNRRQ